MIDCKHRDPLLEIRELSHQFGGVKALEQVDLEIWPGEIVGLIGPNGSGKTTLLNLITGIYPVSSGDIRFAGNDLTALRRHERVAAGIARSFQEPRLFKSLSTLAHPVIAASACRSGLRRSTLLTELARPWRANEAEARHRLAQVGLDPSSDRPADGLPYGHRRILELARCLSVEPRLLLLDEPTAGLNSEEEEAFADLLSGLVRQLDVALLVIDHAVDFILDLCPRLLVLDRGRLIFDGPSSAAVQDPGVIDAYFGEAVPC